MSHQKTARNISAASISTSVTHSVNAAGVVLSVHDSEAPARPMGSQDNGCESPLDHHERGAKNRRRSLTRTGLARAVVNRQNVSLGDARSLVDSIFEEIISALAEGQTLRLRNFGSFMVRTKTARLGRNPRTGAVHPITPRKVVTFRPSPKMRAAVNGEAPWLAPEQRGDAPLRLINLERRARFHRFHAEAAP